MVPAADAPLVDAWFRLAFGCQFLTAARDVEPDRRARVRRHDPPEHAGRTCRRWPTSTRCSDAPEPLAELLRPGRRRTRTSSPSGATSGTSREFPYHVVAELDGRIVGHILLYDRPEGDLRVPEQNIDLAHAATLEDVRGTAHAAAPDRRRARLGARARLPLDDDRLARRQPAGVALTGRRAASARSIYRLYRAVP